MTTPTTSLPSEIGTIIRGMRPEDLRLATIFRLSEHLEAALENENHEAITRHHIELGFELRCASMKIARAAFSQEKPEVAQQLTEFARRGVPRGLRRDFVEIIRREIS